MLRSLLSAYPQVELVGEAGDVMAASELCERIKPDVIFLDIRMPRMDGFALLPLLKGTPAIIFVTAFDKHAIRAFDVNAFDYLLKPIAPSRLAICLSRLSQARPVRAERLLDTDAVALREDSKLRMVPIKAITHIEAEDNYTLVHISDEATALIRRQIGDWENLLPGGSFVRVSRSLIIRIDSVKKFQPISRDRSLVTLFGCTGQVELGRNASMRLKKAIGKQ